MDPALAAIFDASMSYLWSKHTASAQDLEAAISGLLDVVHRAASETALKWNAKTDHVWCRLPAELRAECFQDLGMTGKVALSHTSHLWRLNILAIPSLWSTISCMGSSLWEERQLRTLLQRSGLSSLSLTLKPRIADNNEILGQLAQNISRVKSLTVVGHGYCDLAPLMGALLPHDKSPLPRMETFHVSDSEESLWRKIPKDLCGMLPGLRSLQISTGFPGVFHPMSHLRELRCYYWWDTDGRRIFELCPKLEVLSIYGQLKGVAMLPQGRPPASLRTFDLDDVIWQSADVLEIDRFLASWMGHTGLRKFQLAGIRDLVTPTALFTSVCAGPWKMSVGEADRWRWMHAALQGPLPAGEEAQHCFELKVHLGDIAAEDMILRCVSHFANLDSLEIPTVVFEGLVEAAVSLPAVTEIGISTMPTYLGDEEGLALDRITDRATGPQASRLRAPRLRSVTFLTEVPDGDVKLAKLLHKIIEFDAARLDRVIFSGVHPAQLLDYKTELREVRARDVGWTDLSGFESIFFQDVE